MNRYVIILPPESTVSPTVISTKFPDKTYEIAPGPRLGRRHAS